MTDRKLVPGKFVWLELASRDTRRARELYTALLGWKVRGFPAGADTYEMIFTGDTPDTMIGSFAPLPDGERAHWRSTVAVADVDAAVRAAVAHGGRVTDPPSDIPGVGRRARIADPQGAELGLLTRLAGDTADLPAGPGRWIWNELHTSDPTAALAFYAAVIGFAHRTHDMGSDGSYHVVSSAGVDRGGVTYHLAPGAAPHWLPYIAVADVDATLVRARELGGAVQRGPLDIPGTGRFGVVEDPSGAAIAVMKVMRKP